MPLVDGVVGRVYAEDAGFSDCDGSEFSGLDVPVASVEEEDVVVGVDDPDGALLQT